MATRSISLGKYRALQRCSSNAGFIGVLAIDHQDALKRALDPQNPLHVAADALTQFKLDIAAYLKDDATGVLLDPVYGAAQAICAGTLAGTGLLVELEKADYQMDPLPLDVEIDAQWSVNRIKKMGGDGAKLFFYYNPFNAEHAARQEEIVRRVVADCARYDLPLYAEPIVYQTDTLRPKRELVIESARRIAALDADVLKLEFPVDAAAEPDEAVWVEACEALSGSIDRPWAVLSAGVSFAVFARQVEIACRAGASGFIVGRAVWGDAASIDERKARIAWLKTEGRRRMRLLSSLTALHGRPWHAYYAAPAIAPGWISDYAEMT